MRTLASQPAAPWEPLPLPGRCLSDAFGSGQGNVNVFNILSIRQTQICLIDLFIFLYIMHNYNRYYCTCCTTSCAYFLLSVHHVHFYCFCVLMSFTIPVFPSLEVVKRLCASLRSAARSAVVLRIAARLVLVQFLPCHRRLLQQISNSHLFRSDYVIY